MLKANGSREENCKMPSKPHGEGSMVNISSNKSQSYLYLTLQISKATNADIFFMEIHFKLEALNNDGFMSPISTDNGGLIHIDSTRKNSWRFSMSNHDAVGDHSFSGDNFGQGLFLSGTYGRRLVFWMKRV